MIDLLENKTREIKIGEYGVVKLVDCMPRLIENETETFDQHVLRAARVSYGADLKETTAKEDRGLIRYLWRNQHGTPFEMVDIKFYMSLPIFVARQLIRHRMASVNEYSMRYKQPKDRFFIPDVEEVRKQSKTNKQGSEGPVNPAVAADFRTHTLNEAAHCYEAYQQHVEEGIGKEIARINLPLSAFTEWYWEIDLRNLLGFLTLRMDKHAQKEIRDYANAIYKLVAPLCPYTIEAFNDFTRNAMRLSALEIETIQNNRSSLGERGTDREQVEFTEKLKVLGFKV